MPQAPLIIAIEPDRRQSSKLASLARNSLPAELQIVGTAQEAIVLVDERVPDLILTSLLLSPKDEALLSDKLRELDAAGSHVQTLVIPVLASTGRDTDARGGLFSRLKRGRSSAATPEGCSPAVFGAQIEEYLERVANERALHDASPSTDRVTVRAGEPSDARAWLEPGEAIAPVAPVEPSATGWAQPLPAEPSSRLTNDRNRIPEPYSTTSSWADPFSVSPKPIVPMPPEPPAVLWETSVIPQESAPPFDTSRTHDPVRDDFGAWATDAVDDQDSTEQVLAGLDSTEQVLAERDSVERALAAPDPFPPSEPFAVSGSDRPFDMPLIVEPTSFMAPSFEVRAWSQGADVADSSAVEMPVADARTDPEAADGTEVPSGQAPDDEDWEEIALDVPVSVLGSNDGQESDPLAAEALHVEAAAPAPPPASLPTPLPALPAPPPEPAGSLDFGTFVSALEAADLAARESSGQRGSFSDEAKVDELPPPAIEEETQTDEPAAPRQAISLEPFVLPLLPLPEPVRRASPRPHAPASHVAAGRSAVDEFLDEVAEVAERPFLAGVLIEPEASFIDAVEPATQSWESSGAWTQAAAADGEAPGLTSHEHDAAVAPALAPQQDLAPEPQPLAALDSAPELSPPDVGAREDAWRAADRGTPTSWPALDAPLLVARVSPGDTIDDKERPESLEGIRDHLELLNVLGAAPLEADPVDRADPIAEFISALDVPEPVPPLEPHAPIATATEDRWPSDDSAYTARVAPPVETEPAEAPLVAQASRRERKGKKGRKRRGPERQPVRMAAVREEWGFFDPSQNGFGALLAKLDELSRTGGDASWSR